MPLSRIILFCKHFSISQSTYKSKLIASTPTYLRQCGKGKYHYETIQVNVQMNGVYSFNSNNTNITYGYIYENDFDPSNPTNNLLAESSISCRRYYFKFGTYLKINKTYILVITTYEPYVQGEFSLFVIGPNNVSLNRTSKYF